MSPLTVVHLIIPPEMRRYTSSHYNPLINAESGDREIAFVPCDSHIVPILLNVVRHPPTTKLLSGRAIKWEAWALSSNATPTLRASGTFLADFFNREFTPERVDDLAITPRLPSGAITVLASSRFVFNVDRDSIYLLDLRDNSSRIVFHPGSDQMTIRAHANDAIAMFARNGYRVFLSRLTVNSK